MWSVWKTPEIPPSNVELKLIKDYNTGKPSPIIQVLGVLFVILSFPLAIGYAIGIFIPQLFDNINLLVIIIIVLAFLWLSILYKLIRKNPNNPNLSKVGDILNPFLEAADAITIMPKMMWKLAAVYFFQWYALFCYWQFVTPMLRKSLFNISSYDSDRYGKIMESCKAGISISEVDTSCALHIQQLYEQAVAQTGLMNGTYNLVTMITALALVPFASRYGSKFVYVICLFFTGVAMLSMPFLK